MKRIYHTGPNITSRNRAVLSGGSFCFPCLMEMRMTRTRMEKTGKRIQPLTDRELQGKVGKRFFSDGKAGPFGFRGKIILARRACGIFPANLACTGHDLLWPVVTGTPAPKSRITKNKLLCHSR